MKTPTQHDRFFTSHSVVSGANETALNLLFGPNPITDDELRRLIAKRPHVWGKYAGYLGKRGSHD